MSTHLGPVDMRIPADSQLSRVVRLAASALASTGGFDVDLLDDAKLAVSETVLALCELGSGAPIDLRFEVVDGVFRIDASTPTDRSDLEDPGLSLCRMVLAGVTA